VETLFYLQLLLVQLQATLLRLEAVVQIILWVLVAVLEAVVETAVVAQEHRVKVMLEAHLV
jgi:hypothetical protein